MPIPNPSSAVAGYLPPQIAPAPVPLYGQALEDVFHDVIAGILGTAITDPSLIRPRWQADPPNQPDFNVDWVAFGVTFTKGDWNPYQQFDPTANSGYGSIFLQRDEQLTLLHSYYGPNANSNQSRYEDGIMIEQNRAALDAAGIKLISFAEALRVPAQIKQKWVEKLDQRWYFRRRIVREYPILQVIGADIVIDNEHYLTEIVVSPPP